MSLQLLVENSVKHNIVSKNKPLRIEIYSSEEKELLICNNLQLRQRKENSTGIGLRNINNKYVLLKESGFEWGPKDDKFIVKLPLIEM